VLPAGSTRRAAVAGRQDPRSPQYRLGAQADFHPERAWCVPACSKRMDAGPVSSGSVTRITTREMASPAPMVM
jgi:hypothetical protein